MKPISLSLEAVIAPEAAARLPRCRAIAARRAARARSLPYSLEWLDTATGALAEAGLALVVPNPGTRLLLRGMPGPEEPWCPGTPPPLLATLAGNAVPDEAGGEDLLPLARFEGQRTTLTLRGGVTGALIQGVLHAPGGAAEPAARLRLTGPPRAVAEAMRAIAATQPAAPPPGSLAEQARALALGVGYRPRRLGGPLLLAGMGVEDALARSIGHLAEVMAWHAPIAAAGTNPAGVHQLRVALRRLRSVLRIFRPAADGPSLRAFDAGLKALAGLLGPARDWDVFLGGLGAELAAGLPEEPRVAALLAAGQARRDAAYAALRPALAGPLLRGLVWEAAALESGHPWRREQRGEAAVDWRRRPVEEFAAHRLDRSWRRITKVGEAIAALPDAEFHALRLQAKRLRYAAELFAPLFSRRRSRRFLERLEAVQDQLGLANDVTVARGLVASLAAETGDWASGLAEGWTLARARHARARAAEAWGELLGGRPYWNQG